MSGASSVSFYRSPAISCSIFGRTSQFYHISSKRAPHFFVLVLSVPILKHVPEWFPGAKFYSKAATMRKHAARIRNTMFAATEELMVCDLLPFLAFTR
jgi:hypothetical protein